MDQWNSPDVEGLLPSPQANPPQVQPFESTAPTPEEIAADVAKRQAAMDEDRARGNVPMDPAGDPDGASKAAAAAASAAAERSTPAVDSRVRMAAPVSFPSDPAEAAARHAAAAKNAPPEKKPTGEVAPPSAEKIPVAPRGYEAPKTPKRTPKYLLGAFLVIPGGFSGRVVKVFNDYDEMLADEAVQAAGGPEKVLRGKQGTNTPSTKEQPFYRCRSNRHDFDLVCGELDAKMTQQGTGAPQS